MNIIIDARMVDEHLHGIGRYTYELIRYACKENNINLKLLTNDLEMSKKVFEGFKNVEFIEMKSKFLSISEQLELPKILNKYKGEAIFHSPSFSGSPLIKIPMVMTIHDLNHIRYPQFYTPLHKYYYEFVVKPSAKKSKHLLTVSNFAKGELLDWLGCPSDKVTVTYNGVEECFKPINNSNILQSVKEKYDLPENFFLYVGNKKPHKNVATIIKSISHVKNDLVFVLNGKEDEDLKQVIDECGVRDKVKFIGYIADEDLPVLYSLANSFVFPSLYEGFGLPILEAMACGCPVVTSNTTSLKEIAKDKALTVDPLDYKLIAENIDVLFEDSSIREKLIKDALEYSKEYKWQETFDLTLAVYKELNNIKK